MTEREAVSVHEDYNSQLLYFTCSSLSSNDKLLFEISDKGGSPNVWVRRLSDGATRKLSENSAGYMRSYVYFDGEVGRGLAKASVTLDSQNKVVYYIQDDQIIRCTLDGTKKVLGLITKGEWTAFCHVSHDGKYLCVPTTDHRALDFDPVTEGSGLDKRPVFNIDERVQKEKLSSYLNVYDTKTGAQVLRQRIPLAWITHVQFCPTNNQWILFNNEWPWKDCGIRRLWLSDGKTFRPLRTIGEGRDKDDWVCHEMWTKDGASVIYHGAFHNGSAFVGKIDIRTGSCSEIPLDPTYNVYGHFNVSGKGLLVCDGYFKFPGEQGIERDNSTDNGPDPHKKQARYISLVVPDWQKKTLVWKPLCAHDTDWLGQDSHPHPIFDHSDSHIYFSSRPGRTIGIWRVPLSGGYQ